MRPIDLLFTVGLVLGIAALLMFVLFSGRLAPAVRAKVERVLAWIFWPVVTAHWVWRAVEFGLQDKWIGMVLMAALAVVFGGQGLAAMRQGRLTPVRRVAAS